MSLTIPADSAIRLNYYDGLFLTSDLMTIEQSYFDNMIRLQNQMVYNDGVLEGLAPSLANNAVLVESGGGIDDSGHLLLFPGDSDNSISIPSDSPTPIGVYLQYPQIDTTGTQVSTVDMAAILVVAGVDAGDAPIDSIMIAQVSVIKGIITDVVDKRVAVTSKLPAVLSIGTDSTSTTNEAVKQAAKQTVKQAAKEALDASLHGTLAISASDLPAKQQSQSFEIAYLSGGGAAFTTAPQVVVTPQVSSGGASDEVNSEGVNIGGCLSATISKAGSNGFTVSLTTLKKLPKKLLSIDLNWLAFAKGV